MNPNHIYFVPKLNLDVCVSNPNQTALLHNCCPAFYTPFTTNALMKVLGQNLLPPSLYTHSSLHIDSFSQVQMSCFFCQIAVEAVCFSSVLDYVFPVFCESACSAALFLHHGASQAVRRLLIPRL